MPKKPIDYSKGFIYRLVCKDLSVKEIYVGSSTNFRQRKAQHKCSCTNPNNSKYHLKVYEYMRNNGGWDIWDMVLLEKYPCNDKYELEKRERHWMEELKSSLNSNIPTRTDQEWEEDNKEHRKEYYQQNKEEIKVKSKNWNKNNKDKKAEIGKKYREKHKETITKKKNKKYNCECGGKYTHCHKVLHEKTIKHQNYIQNL